MSDAVIKTKKLEDHWENKLSEVTIGFAFWAGTVTIALVVVVAMVFQRMRRQAWSSSDSVISDAESGASSYYNSEGNVSVVNVDILNSSPEKAFPVDEPSVEVKMSESESKVKGILKKQDQEGKSGQCSPS
jgi:hypothetical protein